MKALLRSPPVVASIGFLIWLYWVLINRTIRWQFEGSAAAEGCIGEGGMILCGWHGNIMYLPVGWARHLRRHLRPGGRTYMLISLSRDGEPVARAIRSLGLHALRGSKSNRGKQKDKGGARALAQAVRLVKKKDVLCITPDGPRGPRREAGEGPALIARRGAGVLVPYGVSSHPAKRLDSWDRFALPLPFGRGAVVYGTPLRAADFENTAELTRALQAALDDVQARAERLAARRVAAAGSAPA